MNHETFLKRAVTLACEGVNAGIGGPFGAVIVKDGAIIAEGQNNVTTSNDPTAHAEVTAIRKACKVLGAYQLDDCILYTSCEPCPMCLGAIYWARPKAVFYAAEHTDSLPKPGLMIHSFIKKLINLMKKERSPFIK